MKAEISFVHLELARELLWPLLIDIFHATVFNFGQLVQLYEKLSNHLFLDRLLVSPGAFHLVPQLDLEWLAESLLNCILVSHVQLHEARLINCKPLQLDLLQQNIQIV